MTLDYKHQTLNPKHKTLNLKTKFATWDPNLILNSLLIKGARTSAPCSWNWPVQEQRDVRPKTGKPDFRNKGRGAASRTPPLCS